ncbi:unnamed protein product [Dibothriocephalus latus]|uniref:Uncharacterized protein n=1 Tax=Dibothriocephalus latus TaxID=60516 RepID=A0A3P7RL51_DIBLA|nr:unnamed protein product [Dibothriocephalus latus]
MDRLAEEIHPAANAHPPPMEKSQQPHNQVACNDEEAPSREEIGGQVQETDSAVSTPLASMDTQHSGQPKDASNDVSSETVQGTYRSAGERHPAANASLSSMDIKQNDQPKDVYNDASSGKLQCTDRSAQETNPAPSAPIQRESVVSKEEDWRSISSSSEEGALKDTPKYAIKSSRQASKDTHQNVQPKDASNDASSDIDEVIDRSAEESPPAANARTPPTETDQQFYTMIACDAARTSSREGVDRPVQETNPAASVPPASMDTHQQATLKEPLRMPKRLKDRGPADQKRRLIQQLVHLICHAIHINRYTRKTPSMMPVQI